MSNRLYIAWQDEATRAWHTVGRLSRGGDGYELVFTKGARHMGDLPKSLFGMDINHRYRFPKLIALFRNRIPQKSRPDYSQIANWVGLTGQEDEFSLLSGFGLLPGSDMIALYPEPEIVNGLYHLDFFVHGIRHMSNSAQQWCEVAVEGARVYPMLDMQNPVDSNAVALRGEGPNTMIGYVPVFYSKDVNVIMKEDRARQLRIYVHRNNRKAPVQHRLLCRLTAPVPVAFQPLNSDEHIPINFESSRLVAYG